MLVELAALGSSHSKQRAGEAISRRPTCCRRETLEQPHPHVDGQDMKTAQATTGSQRKGALDRQRVIRVERWHEQALGLACASRRNRETCTKADLARKIRARVPGVPGPATLVRWLGEKEDTGELPLLSGLASE